MKIMRLFRKSEKEYDVEDFYSDDTRDLLLDEDELSPEEAGFMAGWENAGG